MEPGKYIRKIRLESGISLRGCAKILNISHVFLSNIEHGKKSVPNWLAVSISDVIPNIDKDILQSYISDYKPIKLNISSTNAKVRRLAIEFSRKANIGFSDSDISSLEKILFNG